MPGADRRDRTRTQPAVHPASAGTQLRRVEADHKVLRREADDLLVLAEHGRELDRPLSGALVSRLSRLCQRLGAHFELEERGGYMHEVVARRPGLRVRVARLQREHASFLTEGAKLQNQLLSAVPPRNCTTRVVRLLEALRRHEIAEHDLLLQAFEDDLGSGD